MTASRLTSLGLCSLWLLSTALVCRTLAKTPEPWTRGLAEDPDPVVYDAALLAAAPPEMLAEYDACYLLSRDAHEMLLDGQARITHHFIARVNTRSGLELVGDWPLFFDGSCEQVMLNIARVHKPDGRTIEVPDEDVHVRDENTDYFDFDSYKNLIVSFSQLAVGDVVEVKYTRQVTDPQFKHHYFDSYAFSHEEFPIVRSELLVRLPAGQQLKYAVGGEVPEPQREVTDKAVVYRWRMENVPPHPQQSDLPHDNRYAPLVDFSTFRSWDELAKAFVELRGDRATCTPDIRRQVEQVIEGKDSRLERTQALAKWCRDEVRYLSIHHDAFGFRPHTPAQVFTKRYGNCNDVCQLLSVMLREAGVEPEFVFLNTDLEVQLSHDVPSPMAEHVILLVELDGRQHWIDPTASVSTWDELRGDLCGRKAFGMKDGELRLLETPARRPEQFKIEQETVIELSLAGDAHWEVERRYHAQAAEDWRTYLATITPERRNLETFLDYSSYYPKARLNDRRRLRANLAEVDQPLAIRFSFESPDQMDFDEGELMLEAVSPLLHSHFSTLVDLEREQPLRVDACEIVERLTVRLPFAYELTAVAEEGRFESPWGSVEFSSQLDDDLHAVTYTWHATLKQGRVEPAQLEEYNRFLDEVLVFTYATCWFDYPEQMDDEQLAAARAVLKQRPLDEEAASIVIDALRSAGEIEAAAAAMRDALLAAPDSPSLWEQKAAFCATEEERSETLAEMCRRWPGNNAFRLLLAELHLTQQRYDEAIAAAKELRDHDFDEFLRGSFITLRALVEQGKHESALRQLTLLRRFDRDGDYLDVMDVLEGTIQLRRGRLLQARESFAAVLEFDPQHPEALAGATRVALAQGDAATVRSLLRRYLAIAEAEPKHRVEAARICLLAGRLDDAADLAEAALLEEEQDPAAAAALILVRAARKEYRQALEVPHDSLRAPDVLSALIACCLETNNREAAEKIVATARKVANGDAEAPGAAELKRQLERYDNQPTGASP